MSRCLRLTVGCFVADAFRRLWSTADGAGFGGACVALCRPSAISRIGPHILSGIRERWQQWCDLVPQLESRYASSSAVLALAERVAINEISCVCCSSWRSRKRLKAVNA